MAISTWRVKMARIELSITERDALLVVDVQRDFVDGALAVRGAASIIPEVNRYVELFSGCPIFFTRDWHPEDHVSFKENGGPWPRHCVAGTEGAMIHPDVLVPDGAFIINKGTKSEFDAYSGFQDTCLDALLRERGVRRLFVCGLATDYCVKHTCIGGVNLGYQVFVLLDAVKGVDANPGDSERALEELYKMGVVGIEL